MTDHLTERTCPACQNTKLKGMFVCQDCWDNMFPKTRQWLLITDVCSDQRRMYFYARIEDGADITQSIAMPGKKELMRARNAAKKRKATDGD